jgi:hypothetical protein
MIWNDEDVLTSCGVFKSEIHAINACIRGLVSQNLLLREIYNGNVDENDEDIVDEMYKPTTRVLENNAKFIKYLINYVDGDMEKLIFLCNMIGDHYLEQWKFRIDKIVVDDENYMKSIEI